MCKLKGFALLGVFEKRGLIMDNLLLKRVVVLLIVLLSTTGEAQAGFLNKFKEGFYFEKYETKKEVKQENYTLLAVL